MLKSDILHYSRQNQIGQLHPWFEAMLDELVERQIYQDHNAVEDVGNTLSEQLIAYRKKYNVDTVVIGLSGGVDSALTASLFKSAGWTVKPYLLPIHQNPEETKRGQQAADALDLTCKTVDLSDTYDALMKSVWKFDKALLERSARTRAANLRVRLRMITLYNEAHREGGIVASTDNFSELAAGFWTLHGDVGDVGPIQSLTKSWEVPRMAESFGLPEDIALAKPTDGLGLTDGDEDAFGFSYLEFDTLLLTLLHHEEEFIDRDHIMYLLKVPHALQGKVTRMLDRIKNSSFKRANPFNLQHPVDNIRMPHLGKLDNLLWTKGK